MLMAEITESVEQFLGTVVRKAVPRLIEIEGQSAAEDGTAYLLAEIRMAALLRKAVDDYIRLLVVTGAGSKAEALLDQVLGERPPRPTWKEIGEALGISAQAAHKQHGEAARLHQASLQSGAG